MPGTCVNCYCADKSQYTCRKKGSGYSLDVVKTEKTSFGAFPEVQETENDCKCKCGSSCSYSCTNCSCGGQ